MSGVLKVVGVLALVGLGVFLLMRGLDEGGRSVDFPDGVFFLCGGCGHGFGMGLEEVADWTNANSGAPVRCPECGEGGTVRADRCRLPECGAYFPAQAAVMVEGRLSCPVCKGAMP